jgi:Ca-activated chloride channel homolog
VLSDGSTDPSQALSAAQKLAAQGAEVEIVGIGTPDGAPLKDAKGGFVHDGQGRSVLAKLPIDELRRISSAGHGQYWALDQLKLLIAALDEHRVTPLQDNGVATEQKVESWRNEGIWLMPPILLLALMLARRGWV